MSDCLFCKIVAGEIPSNKVFENDKILAFRDIQPQAPVHILIVPKRHLGDVLNLADMKNGLADNIMAAAAEIAKSEGVDMTGFRLITNCGPDAGQTVSHLHFHLIGGAKLNIEMA